MIADMVPKGLEEGFILDRQWFWLRGEMERTKRPALLALARVFAEIESFPALERELSVEERTLLDRLPQ